MTVRWLSWVVLVLLLLGVIVALHPPFWVAWSVSIVVALVVGGMIGVMLGARQRATGHVQRRQRAALRAAERREEASGGMAPRVRVADLRRADNRSIQHRDFDR